MDEIQEPDEVQERYQGYLYSDAVCGFVNVFAVVAIVIIAAVCGVCFLC